MTAAEKKLAHKRLSALELAEKLGNVSEACRRRGLSRTQFYEYKRRFQTQGLARGHAMRMSPNRRHGGLCYPSSAAKPAAT